MLKVRYIWGRFSLSPGFLNWYDAVSISFNLSYAVTKLETCFRKHNKMKQEKKLQSRKKKIQSHKAETLTQSMNQESTY